MPQRNPAWLGLLGWGLVSLILLMLAVQGGPK